MSDLVRSRLTAFARDRNVDVEDIQQVLEAALADGLLSGSEVKDTFQIQLFPSCLVKMRS